MVPPMRSAMIYDKKGISTILAVVVAAALISVAVIGVYFIFLKDDGDKGLNFDDPVIQGSMGIGSTFTYEQDGDCKYTGYVTTINSAKAEIIGQSGSYYFVLFECTYNYVGEGLSGSSSTNQTFMIHKTSGELRFAQSSSSDSINYEGKDISLKKWKLGTNGYGYSEYNGSDYKGKYTSVYTSTSKADLMVAVNGGIPYKISFMEESKSEQKGSYENGDPYPGYSHENQYDFSFKLKSSDIKESGTYVKSDQVGKGYTYKVEGTEYGKKINAEMTFFVAAEGKYEGIDYLFLMMSAKGNGGSGDIFMVYYIPMDLNDFDINKQILSSYKFSGSEKVETIKTIDGNVACYYAEYKDYDGTENKAWVGKDNGKVYLMESKDENGSDKISLIRNIE